MAISLNESIENIPLVGEAKRKLLERLGINTVRDLLFHIPFKYKDTSNVISVLNLKMERQGTIMAKVSSIGNIYTRSRKVLTKAVLEDESGAIETVWFNQPYLTKSIIKGDTYLFEGKLNPKQTRPQLVSPSYERYYEGETSQKHIGRITPFYPETANLSSKWLRARIDWLLNQAQVELTDPLPTEVLAQYGIPSITSAIKTVHLPEEEEYILAARKRLEFDELLRLALDIEEQIKIQNGKKSHNINISFDHLSEFITSLPYTLTNDQMAGIKDIMEDIKSDISMRRLLNGDVGSGKTVVAAAIMYGILKQGYSSLLMAPTSILARQHHKTLTQMYEKFDIDVQLRTSKGKIEKSDKPQIIVGTHALLFEDELPDEIGLVIVDEQHRFGVNQRKALLERDTNSLVPHYLSMTATPIPRTLTNILFGDMTVSFIREMPKNRIPVKTHYVPSPKRDDGYNWIRERIIESNYKEQAFIIFPLVEESEVLEAKSAKKEYETLSSTVLKDLNVALLHGQMKETEKDEILKEFKDGKYSVLIATPVVEVGIDIPNATMIIIENAERFGLAQLHQFRGRVGRSDMESFCFVIAGDNVEQESEAVDRLKYFSQHNSGFDVAEYDLQRRGPGEVYGLKQSGIPDFKVASITNIELLLKCRKTARELIEKGYNIEELTQNLFK